MTGPLDLPGMRAFMVTSVLGFSGYAALLAVGPLWVVHGGAGPAGSGWVNGVLLLATVLTQLAVPRLIAHGGTAKVLATGMVLLGAPAPFYLFSDALGPVLALSAVRGAGFGILTVLGGSAVGQLVPPDQRGRAAGLFGLAAALPNLALLPLSTYVAQRWGFGVVFAIAAAPLLALAPAVLLGRVLDAHLPSVADLEQVQGRALAAVWAPTVVLFVVTMGGGALITFAPQVLANGGWSAGALLAMGLSTTLSRWRVGTLADRFGPERYLVPLLVGTGLSLAGFAAAAAADAEVALVVAAAVVGVGYGGVQNLTLVLAFARVGPRQVPAASAWWNVGFDSGTACGSVLLGAMAAGIGFPAGFMALASTCAVAVAPALLSLRPRRSG